MSLWTVFFIVACTSVTLGVDGLEITRLSVPSFVMNGTEESVVLDCEYTYDSNEDIRLVVKWFHNDDPNPVYQWIPELNTIRYSDKFDGRINTDYEVSPGDEFTKHRALNILRPTTELSGKYSCHVTSLAGFDSEEDTMMVYALPTSVHLNYSVSDDVVQVMCTVERVFPLPEVEMFQIGPGEVDPSPVDDVELDHEVDEDAFNVYLSTNISEQELATDSLRFFGCVVTLPGTTYEKITKVPYFPAAQAEMIGADDSEDGNNDSTQLGGLFWIICDLIFVNMLLTW